VRGAVGALVTALSLAVLGPAVAAPQGPQEVRAFAVAWKHEVHQVESYETFRGAVRAQFDTRITPHLADDRPNLVTYPEDQGLMAYLVGARGEGARRIMDDGGNGTAALASLAVPYAPQMAYYEAKFPGVDAPGQLLLLALTDTAVRSIIEVFSELARDHGVHVTVSTNVADFERVEGPTAALLADPEAGTAYAYEATTPQVFNQNFLFGPDGELLDAHKKAYLVPLERSRDLGLGMTGVPVDELGFVDLPFGRVGTVTSKDAWMPDVNDRYDQLGAQLLVQPEAFDTWGDPGDDLWPPDKFQRSGWLMTQRHPALRANVTPMLTGHFGEIRFDGQPLIAVEAPGGVPGLCLMGQEPRPGWAAVGRWSDLERPQELCGEDLRVQLAERAERMKPGSGDELENVYAEDVVFADLSFPTRPPVVERLPRGAFDVATPVPGEATQLRPALAAADDGAVMAWVDFREGTAQSVYAARFDPGTGWGEAVRVSDREIREHDHFDNQWAPAVAARGGAALVTYLDFRDESWDVYRSSSGDGGATWGSSARVDDAEEEFGTLRERGHSAPVVLEGPDTAAALWSDLRWPLVNPQIRLARSADGGETWQPSVRPDGGSLTFTDDVLAGPPREQSEPQEAPAAAFTSSGALVVAWQELTPAGPRIRWVRSTDGGGHFTAPAWLSAAGAYRPAVAADGDHVWIAWEERDDAGGSAIAVAASEDAGAAFGAPAIVDPGRPAGVTQRDVTILAGAGTPPAAVFTDDRAGVEDVLWTRLDGPASPVRVNDSPEGADARGATAVRLADGRDLVAWQEAAAGLETLRVGLHATAPSRGGDAAAAEAVSPPSVRTSGCADRSCAAGPRRTRAGGPS
jgi:predicted amidohydrolase